MAKILVAGALCVLEIENTADPAEEPWYVAKVVATGHPQWSDRGDLADTIAVAEIHVDRCDGRH